MKLALLLLTIFSFQLTMAQESGIPTPTEDPARADSQQQRPRIKRHEKHSKKDGHISAKEKKKKNHANRSISKKKHNKK